MKKKSWVIGSLLCCFPLMGIGQAIGQSNANSPLSGQAQVFMQLQQLQNQVAQLQGQLEEQQMQMKQMQKENLARYEGLEKRLANVSNTPVNVSNNSGVIDASTPLTPPVTNKVAADPEKEKIYYEAAFGLIQKKDYPKAVQAFTAFINKFPTSQYAGNAQYWLAEVYLVQGDANAASDNFNKVLQLYPKHPKVPDAMYKLASVQQRLGNNDKAKVLYSEVISKYPYSSAATLAKRSLQSTH